MRTPEQQVKITEREEIKKAEARANHDRVAALEKERTEHEDAVWFSHGSGVVKAFLREKPRKPAELVQCPISSGDMQLLIGRLMADGSVAKVNGFLVWKE